MIPHTDYSSGWCDFEVNWAPEKNRFFAAREQFFDWPDCDAACFDDDQDVTGDKHTWRKYGGEWLKYEGPNLMLRVVVGDMGGVSSSSLGRIRALYR